MDIIALGEDGFRAGPKELKEKYAEFSIRISCQALTQILGQGRRASIRVRTCLASLQHLPRLTALRGGSNCFTHMQGDICANVGYFSCDMEDFFFNKRTGIVSTG